jgi:hypothetical protein
MQKFFSRKSKKPEQESKAGMHERVLQIPESEYRGANPG